MEKENLEKKIKQIPEVTFLENILKTMEVYYDAYLKTKSVFDQYQFDKQYYKLKFFYDEESGTYFYKKYKFPKMGFKP